MRRRAGRSFSGASTSWPSHRGRAKGNRVGIADPIAIVLPMAATSSVVAYGQICKRQSDLVLLLFLLLGGHDLVSLMNSRPKTPRLARAYYKHLVNEWKLNKSPQDAMAPSPAIPVGNLDNASALGELLHQRVGHRAVGRVEIGVPFVEEIDRGISIPDDLLQRSQLALA